MKIIVSLYYHEYGGWARDTKFVKFKSNLNAFTNVSSIWYKANVRINYVYLKQRFKVFLSFLMT